MARPSPNRQGEYTVKEVAGIIAYEKTPEAIAKTMRQIRHWTNNDLLSPLGPKDTGTGINRLYDAHGIRKAAVILELTRYGLNIFMLDMVEEWLDDLSKRPDWQEAIDGTKDLYVQMAWGVGEEPSSASSVGLDRGLIIRSGPLQEKHLGTASMILVNLTALFRRLEL